MKKNVVFITALDFPGTIGYAEFSFKTWRWWCEKRGARLFVWDEQRDKTSTMRPTWMRCRVFDILDRENIAFDQVALVDADTMVRWDCPDFFNMAGGKFCAVRDLHQPRWVKRSIKVYRHLFPGTNLDPKNYFNAGFLIVNHKHRPLFEEMRSLYRSQDAHIRELIRHFQAGSDQTPLNFMAAKHGCETKHLPQQYNHMHFVPLLFNNRFMIARCPVSPFVNKAHIWHFVGIHHRLKERIMARTWEYIKDRYE